MRKISMVVSALLLLCLVFSGCNSNKVKKSETKGYITLKVTCQSAVDNGKRDEDGYDKIIPKNGIYFESDKVAFAENDTVYTVLVRELGNEKVNFEFSQNRINDIGGLKAKDCGNESGWAYYVNGTYKGISCDYYPVNDGDTVEVRYYCSYSEMLKK